MVENNNINIKLEICKDKITGRMALRVNFDLNAPNVEMDKNGYVWVPTIEEKEFINEAFQLFQMNKYNPVKEKMQKNEEDINKKSYSNFPKIEKQKEPTVFEKTLQDRNEDHFGRNIFEKRSEVNDKKSEIPREETYDLGTEIKTKEEKLIIKTDDAAIDAAIKRRVVDDDKSFVEVDEQTIIDKVINQKKKGKLNYRY